MAIHTGIHHRHAARQGFTLVELSIVFTIASFLIYLVGSTASMRIESQRAKTTDERLALIMRAIDAYARRYHHLPCPADPTLALDNASFGDGTGSNSSPANCSAANLQRSTAGATDAPRGAVPIKQLRLNPKIAIDGWDRKFTYVVTEAYTTPGSASTAGYMNYHTTNTGTGGTAGAISVVTSASAYTVTANAAVLVLSHGPNGFGAYLREGSTVFQPTAGSNDEDENANDTTVNNDDVYTAIFVTPTFDDVVEYRLRWQMGVGEW